jgi:putative ABC transport system permease protein
MTWWSRLLRRHDADRDLDDEIRFHLSQEAQLRRERGETAADAERQARRDFGNVALVKETTRDLWGLRLLHEFAGDVRFGLRLLARTPVLAVTAVVSLGVGIGANTAIFTVVNAVLLRPLPYPQPHHLVGITQRHVQTGPEFATWPDFVDWRDKSTTLETIGGAWGAAYNLTGVDEPERLSGAAITPGLFDTLQVEPAIGHRFTGSPDEDARVVLIANDLWRRRFASDPSVIGRRVELNARPHTVIGVMPEGFAWPPATELWVPFVPEESMNRGYHMLQVVGRLKPDTSIGAVQDELTAMAEAAAREYPNFNKDWGVHVTSLLDATVGPATRSLWILSGAAACLLFIACANIASLLASRGVARRLELAMRSALGASRRRLLQQLLTESLVLSMLAGIAGLGIAALAIDPLLSLTSLPRSGEVSIDLRVFAVTVAAAVLTAVTIGLLSAWSASRADLRDVQANRGSARTGWLRPSLLVVEVAAAVVLLAGSGLLIRSFHRLSQVDTGFDADRLLTMRFFLPRVSYPPARSVQLYEQMIERVTTLPGVERAAAVSAFPFSGTTANVVFSIPSQPPPPPGSGPAANFAAVTPGYFRTIGVALTAGRGFSAADHAESLFVAVVNRAMAARFFPGQDPIGQVIRILGPRPRTIVGIVQDIRQRGLDRTPEPEIYVPHAQSPFGGMFLVARATGAYPERLSASARAEIRAIDANLAIANVQTADELLSRTLSARRFSMLLLSIFGAAALVLAIVGIYGVLAYAVEQRTTEIGIRMALGAGRSRVLGLMIWHGVWPVLVGLAIGIAAAAGATRVLATTLFEIRPHDPVTFAAVVSLLLATALTAAYLPARRAALVDPRIALQ